MSPYIHLYIYLFSIIRSFRMKNVNNSIVLTYFYPKNIFINNTYYFTEVFRICACRNFE